MRCSLEQIISVTQGAVRIEEEKDGIYFSRFTREQQSLYAGTTFYGKTLATAGVTLAFRTDSRSLKLAVSVAEGTNRRAFAHDILENGRLIGQLGNLDRVVLCKCADAGVTTQGPGPSLGRFEGSFALGEGEKEIRIVFPWSVVSVLEYLELDDGSFPVPVKKDRKIVFYGDSITQGYDAKSPSRHYAVRLAELLGAEGFNKAVGGDRFRPALASCRDSFEPDDILVAYGTNDWSKSEWETFQRDSLEFYRILSEDHPGAGIWALTPIWRGDCENEKKMGGFSQMEEWLLEAAGRFPNITAIRGRDLVPHESGYYNDGWLHPNDSGFRDYYENLRREMEKNGLCL